MKISSRILCAGMLAFFAVALGGCASDLIEVKPGSRQVTLAEPDQVANCQSKGEITVSVLAKVGFISRSVEEVDANLLQLARNGAVDAGGDTVVQGARPELGTRTFSIYKCHP